MNKFLNIKNFIQSISFVLSVLFLHYLIEFSTHSNTFPVLDDVENLVLSERFILKEEFLFDEQLGIPGRIYIDVHTNKELLYIWALGPAIVNLDNKIEVPIIKPRAYKLLIDNKS